MINLASRFMDAVASCIGISAKQLRFLIVGGFNTFAGLSIYPLLLLTLPDMPYRYLVALLFAQIVCLTFAFVAYKLVVFRTRGNIIKEFGKFSSFYIGIYITNWAVLPMLVEGANVRPIIAQTGFTLSMVFLSYFWHDRVSFRQNDPTDQQADT